MEAVSDALYRAIVQREPVFDGMIYIGIVSTGIVCFPSCRSRVPKRDNVRPYRSFDEAIRDGFRPCKRCRPDHPHRLSPDAELCQRVEQILYDAFPTAPTLQSLADRLHMSPHHLQRVVKRHIGLSPHARMQEMRIQRAKELLAATSVSVAEVSKKVGFQSGSHFTAIFQRSTGMTPTKFRQIQRRR